MTTALIDADILLHRAQAIATTSVEFEPGTQHNTMSMDHAKNVFRDQTREIIAHVGATSAVLCFTDPDRAANWRRSVLASYKHGRESVRPPGYAALAEWGRAINTPKVKAKWVPTLEADDVLGIMQTGTGIPGDKIVCTVDKDLRTVPGRLYDWLKDEIIDISLAEADYMHLKQGLMGDATDGYKGCPGIGKVKAARILDADPTWGAVLAAYEKAGLGEYEALTQLRVARILRAGEYNKATGVQLWTPLTTEAI